MSRNSKYRIKSKRAWDGESQALTALLNGPARWCVNLKVALPGSLPLK